MSDAFTGNDADFERLKTALCEHPKGAWFLQAFAERLEARIGETLRQSIEGLRTDLAGVRSQAQREVIGAELTEMASAIAAARQEIAALKPEADTNSSSRIMAATEELDAIVTATERATSDILGAAERLTEVSEGLRRNGASNDICAQIEEQATNIMMACSFQDITGQRTTKVVNVLRYLEQRVNAMLQIWGQQADASIKETRFNPLDTRPEAELLSGPALEGEGVSQDDIDRMLDDPQTMSSAEKPNEAPVEAPAAIAAESEPAPTPDAASDDDVSFNQDEIDDLFGDASAA